MSLWIRETLFRCLRCGNKCCPPDRYFCSECWAAALRARAEKAS